MLDSSHRTSPTLHSITDVEEVVAELAWPELDRPDLFGIEVEAFPVIVADRKPAGRLPLAESDPNVLSITRDIANASPYILEPATDSIAHPTTQGGRITFEPGAQIEHSSAPQRSSADVRGETTAVWNDLRDGFWEHDTCLLSLGVDPWHDAAVIPQQLTGGRYIEMDAYLGSRSTAGATMMRNTCSVQVNLDAGNGPTRQERWLAANLMSPLLTAMFATSPGTGTASRRALAWQQLDPTRTGFPNWNGTSDTDPINDTLTTVLTADIMYIDRSNATLPGRIGWTFGDWMRDGHPTAGRPTKDDLVTHLTTLFPEVRPRNGVLEFRGVDGLPQAWWHVPLVITAALLYDPPARSRLIELLEPLAPRLAEVWQRAATAGLTDPEIARLASIAGELGIEAARRDPDCFAATDLIVAETYLEHFTLRGRSPGDELSLRLGNPTAALAWAAPEHASKGAA
jgi:glutamate--cysteine ligase